MKDYEKQEIETLPSKYRPIGAWGYFGLTILFSIPLIGTLCLIIFACSGSNVNRRSFARSYFCGIILVAILIGVLILVGGVFGAITEIIQQIIQKQ